MRLGEILVGAGLISSRQLSEALSRQESQPGRMGTQLVHLGLVSPDQIALALSKQHHVPPALVRHFVHHDPAVARLISAKTAAEHFILPIAFSRAGGKRLVVCFRDPHNTELVRALQNQLGLPVVPAVASELAIKVYLEHYYQVDALAGLGSQSPRSGDDGDDIDIDLDDFGEEEQGLDTLELVDLDHHGVEKAEPGGFIPPSKRVSALQAVIRPSDLRENAEPATPAPAAPRPAPAVPEPIASASQAPEPHVPLEELLQGIGAAEKRSAVGDQIMRFLQQRFAAGLMFTIKDGLAMGHRGFGGHLDDPDTVSALMLPLANSVLGAAHDSRALWRGDPNSLSSAAQERFLKLFALESAPREVVVAPVAIGSKVLCLLYAHADKGSQLHEPEVEELAAITEATNAAFERIIRSAKRS